MIDGHGVWSHVDYLSEAVEKRVVRFADKPDDKIDVDVFKTYFPDSVIGAFNVSTTMDTPVFLEDVIIELLNSQTDSVDAAFAEGVESGGGGGFRGALESDFRGLGQVKGGCEILKESVYLIHGDQRWGSASKIDELDFSVFQGGRLSIKTHFPLEGVKIDLFLGGGFVRIGKIITKMTAFGAERDVDIQAQRFIC